MLTRAKRRRLEDHNGQGPSDGEAEHIKRVKAELGDLRVDVLRKELGTLNLPKIGRKRDLIDRLTHHRLLLRGSPFDLLPDELILKILKIAARSTHPISNTSKFHWSPTPRRYDPYVGQWIATTTFDHSIIIHQLSVVSVRFNRICRDQCLWEDCESLRIPTKVMGHVADCFLYSSLRELAIEGRASHHDDGHYGDTHAISGDHIASIAMNCPNLKKLDICKARIDTWPAIWWPSLEALTMLSPDCGADMFRNMQLHLVLPELKKLHIFLYEFEEMWLPDLTKCAQLRELRLDGGGKFRTQKYQKGIVPFPRGLNNLKCWAVTFNLTKQQIREYFEDSNCLLDI